MADVTAALASALAPLHESIKSVKDAQLSKQDLAELTAKFDKRFEAQDEAMQALQATTAKTTAELTELAKRMDNYEKGARANSVPPPKTTFGTPNVQPPTSRRRTRSGSPEPRDAPERARGNVLHLIKFPFPMTAQDLKKQAELCLSQIVPSDIFKACTFMAANGTKSCTITFPSEGAARGALDTFKSLKPYTWTEPNVSEGQIPASSELILKPDKTKTQRDYGVLLSKAYAAIKALALSKQITLDADALKTDLNKGLIRLKVGMRCVDLLQLAELGSNPPVVSKLAQISEGRPSWISDVDAIALLNTINQELAQVVAK